jgi:hypothetical protein
VTFKQAVEQTPNLEDAWRCGLQALRAEDRPHVVPDDPRELTGSADIDAALRPAEPNANRWDFAIGFQHTNRNEELIYWIETHTGSDSQISVVLRKLDWLLNWLKGDGQKLAVFEREIVWVASGATSFTKGAKQVKILAAKGIRYSGARLRIPGAHPSQHPMR